MPAAVKQLVSAMIELREATILYYRDARLRYKVAILTTELKTHKENAAKAREIKQKYNEFRRERWRNAKIPKPE